MTMKVYDADQISISVAGIPLSGFADGEFVTLSYESDLFSDVSGTDGEVTRSKTNDRRATLTVKLMQTSDSNDFLSALFNADDRAANGAGVGAFMLRDRSGRAVYSASECWVSKPPDVSFDREATEREWTFRIAKLEYFTGGS